jgi:zona occludens toxin (predicted ATPase)
MIKMIKPKYFWMIAMLAVALTIAACTSYSAPSTAGQNPAPITTQPSNPATVNPAPAAVKFSDSQYAAYAHLISGDTLDAAAQSATSGFNIQKTSNADGTTTIALSSTNPEYQNQTYTLQSGEQLYFIERNPGDDNGGEGALGDDTAIVVDANGYIVQ